jgi:hypothetical protein
MQVTKASASDKQDQRRLLLSVNYKGTILHVNTDAARLSVLGVTAFDNIYSKAGVCRNLQVPYMPKLKPGCIAIWLLHSCNAMPTLFAGTPKALYGFEPSQLVGRPLATAVDVFGQWRHQFNEDGSLLTLLAARAMDEPSGQGSGSKGTVAGPSWRVGVHLPVKNDDGIAAHAAVMVTDAHLAAQVS